MEEAILRATATLDSQTSILTIMNNYTTTAIAPDATVMATEDSASLVTIYNSGTSARTQIVATTQTTNNTIYLFGNGMIVTVTKGQTTVTKTTVLSTTETVTERQIESGNATTG